MSVTPVALTTVILMPSTTVPLSDKIGIVKAGELHQVTWINKREKEDMQDSG